MRKPRCLIENGYDSRMKPADYVLCAIIAIAMAWGSVEFFVAWAEYAEQTAPQMPEHLRADMCDRGHSEYCK